MRNTTCLTAPRSEPAGDAARAASMARVDGGRATPTPAPSASAARSASRRVTRACRGEGLGGVRPVSQPARVRSRRPLPAPAGPYAAAMRGRRALGATALLAAIAVAAATTGGRASRADATTTSAPTTTTTGACVALPAPGVAADATQLLVVTARSARATAAALEADALVNGCWVRALGPFVARVGWHGLRRHRREGDETTPLGVFALGATLLGDGPDPHDAYPYHRLACGDWWDEDPASPGYDELVRVACGATPPFSGEPLWLEGNAYPILAVIDFNPRRVPGLGSGIFLHADFGQPTDGCVALARPALYRVLAWLRPGDHPEIAIRVAR